MRIYAKQERRDRVVSGGVVLGRHRQGDRVLPIRNDEVVWAFDELAKPALVMGTPGSGKTETLLRILHEIAVKGEEPVWSPYFLDAKGDRQMAERFVALMEASGRKVKVFPHERFNGWQGDWKAIVNRLLQVIHYESTGPAAFFRDVAKTVLQVACRGGEQPPRSSTELLERLSVVSLAKLSDSRMSSVLTEDLVDQVRVRYEAFFGQIGTALDGDWSWEDADAAYLLLDSIGTEEDAASVAAYLFADFGHYFKMRKPREQKCVLAIDEFSAVARTSNVALLVEQARGFNAFLLLAPQTVAGMGSEEQQSRILGSVDVVICHNMKEPWRVAELAGKKTSADVVRRYVGGQATGEWQVSLGEAARLEPDQIRELGQGEAWVLRGNRAMRVAVTRAPELEAELPEEKELNYPESTRTLSDHAGMYPDLEEEES